MGVIPTLHIRCNHCLTMTNVPFLAEVGHGMIVGKRAYRFSCYGCGRDFIFVIGPMPGHEEVETDLTTSDIKNMTEEP
jgi:hypothetical protein